VPAEVFETSIQGFKDGLAAGGYVEGENLTLIAQHCNADMGMLTQVTQSLANRKPDLFVALSTPCLGNALTHVQDTPIVFGIVSSPLTVKAGESYSNHLPNVTGAVFKTPTEETFRWARELFPNAVRIGTVFNPSEANSVDEVAKLKQIFKSYGFELVTAPVMNSNEILQATQSVMQKGIDLFFAMGDNTTVNGLSSILKICKNMNIPVLGEDGSLMGTDVLLSCGPGPYREGQHTAEMAIRVLEGASPAEIPFEPSTHFSLQLDFEVAQRLNLDIPDAMKQELDVVHHLAALKGRPAKISIVNLVENHALNAAIDGIEIGLQEHGLRPDLDYKIKKYCAQGDLSLLSQIFDTAAQDHPDVIVSITSPACIAGINRIKDIPLVFSVSTDPKKLGLFKNGRPGNVTGVHDHPALNRLLDMAKEFDPTLNTLGIVYDAAQPQSQLTVNDLQIIANERNLKLLKATASTVSDLSMATRSVIQRGAQALILSTDNLATSGFAAIHKVTAAENVPVFVTDMQLMDEGATGGIGDDYSDWGKQSAGQVLKVLTGLSPAAIPVEQTRNARVDRPKPRQPARKNPLELRLVMYNETQFAEDCARGLQDGLTHGGLVEGKDYNLRVMNAQGDMSTLSSIMTSVKSDQVDLLMVISTPCLQAALRQAGSDTRIVFTGVGDGVKAGGGKSETDHLPNVTGITTRSPFDGMARLIKETLPNAKAVGTLYTPAEINSELYRKWFQKALAKVDIDLISVPVTSSADTAQSSIALCREDIQAVAQIVDNTTRPGFAQIARKANDNNLPVYVFDSSQMADGAVFCIARDYYDAGLEGAEKALRVLNGTSPADIPFSNTQSEKMLVNIDLAKKFGLILSGEMASKANKVK
jgi:ABC-type uncharacterized transport system substrate-binding protein